MQQPIPPIALLPWVKKLSEQDRKRMVAALLQGPSEFNRLMAEFRERGLVQTESDK
jgi:hypothetical protein